MVAGAATVGASLLTSPHLFLQSKTKKAAISTEEMLRCLDLPQLRKFSN